MAFIEQDDTGLIANANAYISLVEMKAYHADRGLDLSAIADAELEAAIVTATDYLDSRFTFPGEPLNGFVDQTTSYPRKLAYWSDGVAIAGIPVPLKEACSEYAQVARTEALYQPNTTSGTTGEVKKRDQSVDVIKDVTEYFDGTSGSIYREIPNADQRLYASGVAVTASPSFVRGA